MADPTTALQPMIVQCQIPSASGDSLTTTLLVVLGAVLAAIIAGDISRRIKISEFRQEWINDLRKDIAEYISKAEEWLPLNIAWVSLCLQPNVTQQAKDALLAKADNHRYDTLTVLRRIKLRFNPEKTNPNIIEDDAFLNSLDNLLSAKHNISSWQVSAEDALSRARHILKREWDVTKSFWKKWAPFR